MNNVIYLQEYLEWMKKNKNFAPDQETREEYLRRVSLDVKLNKEWNNTDEKEKKKSTKIY